MRFGLLLLLLAIRAAASRSDQLDAHDGRWSQVYDQPSNIIREIEMFDDSYGLALTGPGILRTVDGGQTWTEPEGRPLIATGEIEFANREIA